MQIQLLTDKKYWLWNLICSKSYFFNRPKVSITCLIAVVNIKHGGGFRSFRQWGHIILIYLRVNRHKILSMLCPHVDLFYFTLLLIQSLIRNLVNECDFFININVLSFLLDGSKVPYRGYRDKFRFFGKSLYMNICNF